MTEITTINLFYPLLFLTIIILAGLTTFYLFKNKDNNLFGCIFNKHANEHIEVHTDTTSKMENMHTKVVDGIPEVYHQELHSLEVSVKSLTDITVEINQKLDILIEQIVQSNKRKVVDISSKKHK